MSAPCQDLRVMAGASAAPDGQPEADARLYLPLVPVAQKTDPPAAVVYCASRAGAAAQAASPSPLNVPVPKPAAEGLPGPGILVSCSLSESQPRASGLSEMMAAAGPPH